MPETVEATAELLLGKQPRTETFPVDLTDAEGREVRIEIKARALGSKAYDDLVAQHPPKNKNSGEAFDSDSFGPALLSACLVSPELNIEQARQIWTSDTWGSGEIVSLFNKVMNLNMAGLNVPFTSAG